MGGNGPFGVTAPTAANRSLLLVERMPREFLRQAFVLRSKDPKLSLHDRILAPSRLLKQLLGAITVVLNR